MYADWVQSLPAPFPTLGPTPALFPEYTPAAWQVSNGLQTLVPQEPGAALSVADHLRIVDNYVKVSRLLGPHPAWRQHHFVNQAGFFAEHIANGPCADVLQHSDTPCLLHSPCNGGT